MEQNTLTVRGLRTEFHTPKGILPAADGVDLAVPRGKIVGLVGESGCGKSVTALSVMGLVREPGRIAEGEIFLGDRDLRKLSARELQKLRGDRMAMIFQDPMTSLNPVYTVGRQVSEALRLHKKMDKTQAREKTMELFRQVGIPDPEGRFNAYPRELSGGLRQRVMIAMAMACEPELLIADEPTTALDVTIQAQILELLQQLSADMGMSILLITHNFGVVAETCDRVSVMYAGKVVETGDTRELLQGASHPYSRALIRSIPGGGAKGSRLETIPGSPPALFEPPLSCMFAPRCPYAEDRCLKAYPAMADCGGGHLAACFKPLDKEVPAHV